MMKELKVNVSCKRLSILRGDSKSRWKSNPWVLISQSYNTLIVINMSLQEGLF